MTFFDQHIINLTSCLYHLNTKDVPHRCQASHIHNSVTSSSKSKTKETRKPLCLGAERFKQVLQPFITRCRLCPSRFDSSSIKTWKNGAAYDWNAFTTLFISQELIHYVCIPLCLYINVITKTKIQLKAKV